MTDWDAVIGSMERYRERRTEVGKLNKAIIFDALAAAGIDSVTVEFDGEDDSGQISDVLADRSGARAPLPELNLTIHSSDSNSGEDAAEEISLADAIERLCYDYLGQEHGGWENNDGAYGAFMLTVADRSVHLVFNGRYSDVYTHTQTF